MYKTSYLFTYTCMKDTHIFMLLCAWAPRVSPIATGRGNCGQRGTNLSARSAFIFAKPRGPKKTVLHFFGTSLSYKISLDRTNLSHPIYVVDSRTFFRTVFASEKNTNNSDKDGRRLQS